MQAGKLDRRITIERFTATLDALGGEIRTWAPLATVWASATPSPTLRSGERPADGEPAATAEMRFQIRWGLGVTVLDRIAYDGRHWNISRVNEIGRRVGQDITAATRAE